MKRFRAVRRRRGGTFLLFAGLLATAVAAASDSPLTEAQRRGRRIYTEGKGRAPIAAVVAGTGLEAPGSSFPCINCHTEDGAGTVEGGVRSADITWATLTKEHAGTRPSGRAHGPYDEASLARAITAGRDPAGVALKDAHPRFRIGAEDLSDLVAYVKILGNVPVPGVLDNEVRVGMLLPARGPLAAAGAEVRRFLSGCFEEVNARGGVFRRKLRLVPVPFDPEQEGSAAAAARQAVADESVFCFVANLGVPPGDEAARVLAESRVPVIAPLLTAHAGGYGADRYTFHVLASLSDQGRVMVDFIASGARRAPARIGILYASDGSGESGAAGVREQARKRGIAVSAEAAFRPGAFAPEDAVARLRAAGPDVVAYFGGGREFLELLAEAGRREWRPDFVAPAPLVGGSVAAAARETAGSVYLTSPLPSPDAASEQTARFAELERKYGATDEHRSFRVLAYAAALTLDEGLKRCGRAVTREKLVGRLGTFYEFRTGVVPPLTYNENRRVGARGASVVRFDPGAGRFVTVSPWSEPE